MKKIITFIFAISITGFSNAQAPDSWTEKNAIGQSLIASSFISARTGAVSFSIGTKGYVGTGADIVSVRNDFWEYDPTTNIWTQKANFGGGQRKDAVGFSIGTKGYIGTGMGPTGPNWYKKDFWEYNPASNAWIQKADFGGTARLRAIGISNGSKGYIGTGEDGDSTRSDFWEYNPVFNSWVQKANFGGGSRYYATGFNISTNVFVGTGYYNGSYPNDFWKYNPSINTWTQQANFSGSPRRNAVGFNIGNKGYIGTGWSVGTGNQNDLWEYDPASNVWSQKANFGTTGRSYAIGFSIGLQGYIGMGNDGIMDQGDIWEYNSTANTWIQKNNLGANKLNSAVGFDISGKGYIGTGSKKDFWEFDPAVNLWTQKADFGGTARIAAVGFSIGNKGYIGTGSNAGVYKNDFWEYNPSTNAWTQKANFNGAPRHGATGFSIGNKGYIGTGSDAGGYKNDFWEYSPLTNAWTQKANFGGSSRNFASGFSIGNKGYLGTGYNGANLNDFWEYNPVTNNWAQKLNFSGASRHGASGFSLGNKGYIGTGYTTNVAYYNDFWEYDPLLNTWTQRTNFGGSNRYLAVSFSIKTKGYLGTGSFTCDWWEYTPICSTPVSTIYSSGTTTFCSGDSTFLYANKGYDFQWKKNGVNISGATSYFYYAKLAGSYTCTLTNSCGVITSTAILVTVSGAVPATPGSITTTGGVVKVCPGESRTYTVTAVTGVTYTWTPCAGSVITNGQGTNSVTIQYNANFPASDTLRVIAINSCGNSAQRKLKISRNMPGTPAAIIGNNFGVCNLSGIPFSVTNVTGMTYAWSFNTGTATVASGQGTSSITTNYGAGFVSGSLSVTASNGCGTSAPRVKTIYAKPATPVSITGATSVCLNQQNVPYSIAPLANVTNYTWTGPTGSHISDGITTSAGATLITTSASVTVDFATTAGAVKVRGNNACASGSYKTLSIAIVCREGDFSNEISETRIYPNPASTDFTLESDDVAAPIDLDVYDALGKLIYSEKNLSSGDRVDTHGWADGLYSVVVRKGNNMTNLKLVIQGM